jgi:outer membrane receptor protein involved in Fe transport
MRKPYWSLIVAPTLATLALSAPVLAQDQETAEAGALEEVIITGSRIRQNPLEVRTPVQFINEADIDATGTLSVGDYLQRLPISGSSINRMNNSSGNLGFPPDGSGIGAGASEIDLRYLTSKRTLVLVDGRRWIRGSSASGVSGAVDLNTIPSNAIKSIEILQDGASAIYGSDAIGGVVNIITSDNYDGFKVTGYYGQFDGPKPISAGAPRASAPGRWSISAGRTSRRLAPVTAKSPSTPFAAFPTAQAPERLKGGSFSRIHGMASKSASRPTRPIRFTIPIVGSAGRAPRAATISSPLRWTIASTTSRTTS